jgi:coenzyme F420-0:L-glutamate ligase/coenzyme F420-1:gamma-L-glutamate ligase
MTVIAWGLPISSVVGEGDSITDFVLASIRSQGLNVEDRDIFVISSKIVSKAEGRVIKGKEVIVSPRAESIASDNDFDPVHVELALREAVDIVRSQRVLITETHTGLVCNFSGVDKSNTEAGTYILLPKDPDGSAQTIRQQIQEKTGRLIAVVISDTQGRPWRKGSINVAIGCSGISPFKINKGKKDLYGRSLKRSTVCQVDEISSLAENLMGQAAEKVPVVLVRGYQIDHKSGRCADINRSRVEDLTR